MVSMISKIGLVKGNPLRNSIIWADQRGVEQANRIRETAGEDEVCTTFRVSRTVVGQALNKLSQDGIIYKEKGRGTFVAKPKLQEKFIQSTYGSFQKIKEDRNDDQKRKKRRRGNYS